jgi:hypothetical protein
MKTFALRIAARVLALVVGGALLSGCPGGPPRPLHRERFTLRDAECREPARPHAFMYPAENRNHYGPDDPAADGCLVLVPDHLFCCPAAARATDR